VRRSPAPARAVRAARPRRTAPCAWIPAHAPATPPRPAGFDDVLQAPWSTSDALRRVWAAALAQPVGPELPHLLRVYLPSLEALHYEGARRRAPGLGGGFLDPVEGFLHGPRAPLRQQQPAKALHAARAPRTPRPLPAPPTLPGPSDGDMEAMLQALAECEQAPGGFRLRVLRLEPAPAQQAVAFRVDAPGPDGGGGCTLRVTLRGPQAWGAAPAAALLRRLPAFRRLQVLLVRGLGAEQEDALTQVRRGGVSFGPHADFERCSRVALTACSARSQAGPAAATRRLPRRPAPWPQEWARLAGGAPQGAHRDAAGWLRLERVPDANARRLADLEACLAGFPAHGLCLRAAPRRAKPPAAPPRRADARGACDQGAAAAAAEVVDLSGDAGEADAWDGDCGGCGGGGGVGREHVFERERAALGGDDSRHNRDAWRMRGGGHRRSRSRSREREHKRGCERDRERRRPRSPRSPPSRPAPALAPAPGAGAAGAPAAGPGGGARAHIPSLRDQLGLQALSRLGLEDEAAAAAAGALHYAPPGGLPHARRRREGAAAGHPDRQRRRKRSPGASPARQRRRRDGGGGGGERRYRPPSGPLGDFQQQQLPDVWAGAKAGGGGGAGGADALARAAAWRARAQRCSDGGGEWDSGSGSDGGAGARRLRQARGGHVDSSDGDGSARRAPRPGSRASSGGAAPPRCGGGGGGPRWAAAEALALAREDDLGSRDTSDAGGYTSDSYDSGVVPDGLPLRYDSDVGSAERHAEASRQRRWAGYSGGYGDEEEDDDDEEDGFVIGDDVPEEELRRGRADAVPEQARRRAGGPRPAGQQRRPGEQQPWQQEGRPGGGGGETPARRTPELGPPRERRPGGDGGGEPRGDSRRGEAAAGPRKQQQQEQPGKKKKPPKKGKKKSELEREAENLGFWDWESP
jgi:hypothetical protein